MRVSEETWERLNRRRGPGDTFDEIIEGLLDSDDTAEAEQPAD